MASGYKHISKAHRIYSIETSDAWTTIPFTSPPGGKSFFRFHVAEP